MSVSGALNELESIIEAIDVTPAFRSVDWLELADLPGVSGTNRRFHIDDVGVSNVGQTYGVGSTRRERRIVEVKVRYFARTDFKSMRDRMLDDESLLMSALIRQENWAGSSNILAVHLEPAQAVSRDVDRKTGIGYMTIKIDVTVAI